MSSWQFLQRGLAALALTVGVVTAAAAAEPTLRATPAPGPAGLGSSLVVTLSVADITDLFAYQLSLSYDPSQLQLRGVTAGSFLAGAGSTVFDGGVIDNGSGQLSLVYESLIGAVPGASGAGPLASLRFDVIGVGSSSLNFSELLFLDASLNEIAVQAVPGLVTTVSEPASALLLALGLAGVLHQRRRLA